MPRRVVVVVPVISAEAEGLAFRIRQRDECLLPSLLPSSNQIPGLLFFALLEQKMVLNQGCFYPGCFTHPCCCLEMLFLLSRSGRLPTLCE